MLITIWRFVTLLLVALLTGWAFAHVLERPAKMLYDAGSYVTVQKTVYEAWGPPNVGGILEPAAILATIILALCGQESRHSHSRLAQRWRSCSLFRWCSSSSSHRRTKLFAQPHRPPFSRLDRVARELGKRPPHPLRTAVGCTSADPLPFSLSPSANRSARLTNVQMGSDLD
jgi:hypothetical protein